MQQAVNRFVSLSNKNNSNYLHLLGGCWTWFTITNVAVTLFIILDVYNYIPDHHSAYMNNYLQILLLNYQIQ